MQCAHLRNTLATINTIGIDVGKNTFHLVGLDKRGAIVLQQKVTRHQLGRRLGNIPRCLIGMETCSGTHFIARRLAAQLIAKPTVETSG
jgi:transposase